MAFCLRTVQEAVAWREKQYPQVAGKPVPREIVEYLPRSRYDIALDKFPTCVRRAASQEEIDAWWLDPDIDVEILLQVLAL